MLTQEYLKECFQYDADTGLLTWKTRPLAHFKNKRVQNIWHSRFAGKEAGCVGIRQYRKVKVGGYGYFAHRLIWMMIYGAWPDQIDHVSGDGLDNRLANLRNVSSLENGRNSKRSKSSSSGVTGVSWKKASRKWYAQIKGSNKRIHLGYTPDFFEAICLRKSAELKHGFHINHGRA